ncbi:MAG: TonB-dependent receptor [Candidatus Marinimicrobia bacterium]|nr:TonB-dependent receptor [Candidatus Neomarinimicrobiota bacterium]MCF7839567.1 TonB-dependent receptor [Candidatus Neomarinimicrobiota bacterium]
MHFNLFSRLLTQNMRVAISVMALLFLAIPVQGQHVIEGRIVSAYSREPVPGANIVVEDTDVGTMSRENGYYKLTVTAFPVTLKITHIAFNPHTTHIVMSGRNDIRLMPKVLSGEEVLVTANRAVAGQSPVAFSEVSHSDIADSYSHQDVPMVLNEQPGVYAYSDAGNGVGYSYVTIRGFKQDRIGVMLNGIPLNDPEAHSVYWVDHGDVLASSNGIQIQRGVGNALYGAANFGGSINLVTQFNDLTEGITIKSGYGDFIQSGTSLSNPSRKYSISLHDKLSIFNTPTNLYARVSGLNSGGYRDGSGTEQLSWHAALEQNRPGSTTRFEVFMGDQITAFAWDGIAPAYGYDLQDRDDRRYNYYADPVYNGGFDSANKDVFKQWIVSLKHLQKAGPGFWGTTLYYVNGNGYYEQYKGEDDPDDLYDFLRLYNLLTVTDTGTVNSAEIIRRKWLDNEYAGVISQYTLKIGVLTSATGFNYRDYGSRHYGQVHEGLSPGITSVADHVYYDDNTWKKSYSIFQQGVYDFTERLNAQFNLRLHGHRYTMDQAVLGAFDGSHDFKLKYDFFDWQAGFHFQISDRFGGYASVSTNQREPADGDIFEHDEPDTPPAIESQPDSEYATALVKPEKVIDYELGFDWSNPGVSFQTNLYWMNFQNELIPVDYRYREGSDQILHANATGTVHRGIELSAAVKLPLRLTFTGNATLSDNYFKDFQGDSLGWGGWGGIADYSGKKIPGAPATMLNLKLKEQFSRGSVWLSSRTVGKQYIDFMNREDATIPAYTVLNAGMHYNFNLRLGDGYPLSVAFWVNNLTDELYETFGYNYFNSPEDRIDVYWPAATRNWFAEISIQL